MLTARLRSPTRSLPATISCRHPGLPSLGLGGGRRSRTSELWERETFDQVGELRGFDFRALAVGVLTFGRLLLGWRHLAG